MNRDPSRILAALLLSGAMTGGPALAQSTDAPAEAPAETAPETPAEGATEAPAEGAAEAPAEAPETIPMEQVTAATVLATVNGRDITLGEVISLRSNLPPQYQGLPDETLYEGLLNQIIDQSLLEQQGREAGMAERLDVALSLVNQVRAVLAEAYIIEAVQAELTEERLQAEYETRIASAEAEAEEEVRARHILVPTEDEAKAIIARLEAGEEFEALAMELGTDGTAPRGGDLGFFSHADMVPEFADAAYALETGEVSAPVQSPFGWHVIKLEERRVPPAPSFEEVRPALEEEMGRVLSVEIMEKLRAGATIEMPEVTVPVAAIRADGLIAAE